jgi:hypothetical protein
MPDTTVTQTATDIVVAKTTEKVAFTFFKENNIIVKINNELLTEIGGFENDEAAVSWTIYSIKNSQKYILEEYDYSNEQHDNTIIDFLNVIAKFERVFYTNTTEYGELIDSLQPIPELEL